MDTRRKLTTGLLIILLTIGGTIVHGRLTNRWGRSDAALRVAARALASTPDRFGPWVKIADHEFSSNVPGILNFAGAINRSYLNTDSGQTVAVAIIVGPPGPTSTHVAEMCYNTRGWRLVEATDLAIPASAGAEHHFRRTLFDSPLFETRRQEVCYAWRAAGLWETPPVPRVSFGTAERLFKIQVAASYGVGGADGGISVCQAFLTDFVPALDTAVFAAAVR